MTFLEKKRRLDATWVAEARAQATMTSADVRVRLLQVVGYLEYNYPVAFPVTLRVERGARQSDGKFLSGEAWRLGRRFFIRANPEKPKLSRLIDTLIHEWAHLRTIKHATVERHDLEYDHGPEWGIAYAELYSDFFDHDDDPKYLGGAWEASRKF